MRTTTSDKRIAFWPVALAGLVAMAVAVSGPVLSALIALLALAATLASVRILPRVVAYLLVASAASVPLGWLSPNLGIIGGLGALLWLLLSTGWMMVHGAMFFRAGSLGRMAARPWSGVFPPRPRRKLLVSGSSCRAPVLPGALLLLRGF